MSPPRDGDSEASDATAAATGDGGRRANCGSLRPVRAVVRRMLVVEGILSSHGLVEVRGLLDLVLRHRHEDLAVIMVNPGEHPGRNQALLAEDPEPGVYDQVLTAGLGGRLVDVADASIGRFDVVPDEPAGLGGVGDGACAITPHLLGVLGSHQSSLTW